MGGFVRKSDCVIVLFSNNGRQNYAHLKSHTTGGDVMPGWSYCCLDSVTIILKNLNSKTILNLHKPE